MVISKILFEQLTQLLEQLKEADRLLIDFLVKKTPKQEVAKHFGITVDGVYYKEKQLKKQLRQLPLIKSLLN